MIPDDGFLASDDLAEPLLDTPLPVPFEGTYADRPRRGRPSSIIGLFLGDAEIELNARTFDFDVTIRLTGVHGVAMLDRLQ